MSASARSCWVSFQPHFAIGAPRFQGQQSFRKTQCATSRIAISFATGALFSNLYLPRRRHVRRWTCSYTSRDLEVLPEGFRFSLAHKSGWQRCLQEEGVAVLSGVLGKSEVSELQGLLWQWLEGYGSAGRVSRANPSSWTVEDGRWPLDNASTGIICVRGAGQTLAAWRVRGHAVVQQTFAVIWGVEPHELLTSMDGIILWRPWQRKPSGVREAWKTRASWLHSDQNVIKRPDLEAVQGLVTLTSADPFSTGGFVCVPGSHLPDSQKAFCARLGGADWLRKRGDFLAVPEGDPLEKNAKVVRLQPGDLLLWDGRLIHGSEPAPAFETGVPILQQTSVSELLRMALPVCMVPRGFAQDATKLSAWRADVVAKGMTTKHWPHKQRVQGLPAGPDFPSPELTPSMLRVL